MNKALLIFAVVALACALTATTSTADVPSNLQSGHTHMPPTITNLNATRGGPTKITLTWTMTGHSGYIIKSVTVHRVGTNPNGTTFNLGPVTRWSDLNATPGVDYHYGVCAHDSGHETGCAYVEYRLHQ